jgi:hypothetical protein
LTAADAAQINRRRTSGSSIFERMQQEPPAWPAGAQAHIGNTAEEGQVYPADVVRTWGDTPESAVNLQVKLDGNDTFWVTSATVSDGPEPGKFHWMPYQVGQAAKTEAAEARADAAESAAGSTAG